MGRGLSRGRRAPPSGGAANLVRWERRAYDGALFEEGALAAEVPEGGVIVVEGKQSKRGVIRATRVVVAT
jgi:hypothetical protein